MEKQFVVFELEKQNYAVEIHLVNEITEIIDITSVPDSAEYVEGILNLRSVVIPVINLKKRLSIVEKHNENRQIIVINMGSSQIGLIIDSAKDVKNFDFNQIETVPEVLNDDSNYFSGIIKHDEKIISILDVQKLLSESQKDLT